MGAAGRMATAIALAALAACGGAQRGGAGEATCAEAAGTAARHLRAVRAELADADLDGSQELAAACTADRWAAPVRGCFRDARTPAAARTCAGRLTEPQRASARTVQGELLERAAVILSEREPQASATGMAECDRYLKAIDALIACPAAPVGIREALTQSRDGLEQTWARLGDTAGERDAAREGCKHAFDAIVQTAAGMGC